MWQYFLRKVILNITIKGNAFCVFEFRVGDHLAFIIQHGLELRIYQHKVRG